MLSSLLGLFSAIIFSSRAREFGLDHMHIKYIHSNMTILCMAIVFLGKGIDLGQGLPDVQRKKWKIRTQISHVQIYLMFL